MQFKLSDDDRISGWKIGVFQAVVGVTFFALLAGYWRLQIGQHKSYLEQSERNRIRSLPIIAPRGRILDRKGRVLVDNIPAFSILLLRDNAPALTPDKLGGIARGLNLEPEELAKTIAGAAKLPRFQPILLKQYAQIEDAAFVESHRVEYPELALLEVQERQYPNHAIGAATLGYVGEVSQEMLATSGSPYRPGDVVGKAGIERAFNSVLSGKDGMRRTVVNSRGQEVGALASIESQPGTDLRLTLDLDLEAAAENALGGHDGAIVAVDPRNGEVLAMVSHPTYDPNDFAHRIDRGAWDQLVKDPRKPLMNKAIQAQLAPGSVFKIVTATTALETDTITPEYTIHCPGAITIYGHTYHDWVWEKHKAHGTVDLHRAIVVSCDVYFYNLGKLLGIDRIAYFAKHLGLGARTGIDLPSEEPGLVPSPEWAMRVAKRPWYAGETISVAIGQGAVTVTPLQLAYMIAGVESNGTFERPHLCFRGQLPALDVKQTDPRERVFPIKPSTVNVLTQGMWGVVHEGGGTGIGARSPGLEIAGKTGTAQVVSEDLQKATHDKEFKNNAWFVGFWPVDRPEIVVAGLVLKGEHSSVAVPVVRDVIKTYAEMKQAKRPPSAEPETQVKLMSKLEKGN